ncbi:hypothetical protein Patl1_07235 [Pistacia atlantica]|uniref:Uncharacterized protein n=1 Tax=Pistacia atlantica TaxID=434234 RepID=A0ACC1AJG8_9ROSI|nr:hypothetical protein Patl1_07235 [Pistacia atlantica]
MRGCRGLALCFAFSVHDPKGFWPHKRMKLNCNVQLEIIPTIKPSDTQMTPTVSMSVPLNSLAGTDHLWLFYISGTFLTNNDFFYLSGVSFGDKTDEGITMKVKACGLRPVYYFDIGEVIRASNNRSSNTSPVVLDPDRLAVTSTIIKRSRNYCPDPQPYPKRLKFYCLSA